MDDKEITKMTPGSSSSVGSSSSSLLPSSSNMSSSSSSASQPTIKLIVKAPLQLVEDKIVECDLTWTVAKLKAQISDIYPNKPSVNDQRLIFSGHLLKNEQILGDILKAPSDNSTYTVHLVCNVKSSSSKSSLAGEKETQKQAGSQQPSSSNPGISNEMNNPTIRTVTPTVTQSNNNNTNISDSPSTLQNDLNSQLFSQATLNSLFSGYPFMMPAAYPWTNLVNPTDGVDPAPTYDVGSINVDQMNQNVAWMSSLWQFQMFQQMYAQYLAQHLSQPASFNVTPQLPDICFINGQLPQSLNPPGVSVTATLPQTPQINNNLGNNGVDAAPAQEPIAPRLEPQAPVAGVRLNPAPAVAADDDDEMDPRDWIYYLSLLTQAGVLASFIFLYASWGRFTLVVCLYCLYRALTTGAELYNILLDNLAPGQAAQLNRLNNNNNNDNFNNNNNNVENNNNNLNDGPNRLQQVMDGNIDNHHANGNSNNNNNSVPGRSSSNEPTKIRLFFLMLKALFASLIPLQPPPLYPNQG